MQKSITAANRIPVSPVTSITRPTAHQEQPSLDVSLQSSEEKDALEKMLQEALSLSEEIFDLQEVRDFTLQYLASVERIVDNVGIFAIRPSSPETQTGSR